MLPLDRIDGRLSETCECDGDGSAADMLAFLWRIPPRPVPGVSLVSDAAEDVAVRHPEFGANYGAGVSRIEKLSRNAEQVLQG